MKRLKAKWEDSSNYDASRDVKRLFIELLPRKAEDSLRDDDFILDGYYVEKDDSALGGYFHIADLMIENDRVVSLITGNKEPFYGHKRRPIFKTDGTRLELLVLQINQEWENISNLSVSKAMEKIDSIMSIFLDAAEFPPLDLITEDVESELELKLDIEMNKGRIKSLDKNNPEHKEELLDLSQKQIELLEKAAWLRGWK